jgi:uncharacterized protein YabE (DUF348 family)
MEDAGWKKLLGRQDFVNAISKVNVFVASHHGRDNGCCDELFSQAGLRPTITIISDSGIEYATQETVAWYRHRTVGINYEGENRHVFTTRRDGAMELNAIKEQTTIHTKRNVSGR